MDHTQNLNENQNHQLEAESMIQPQGNFMPFDDDELKGDGSPRGSISSEEEKNPDKAKKRKKRKKK